MNFSPDDQTDIPVALAKMQGAIENLATSVASGFKQLHQQDELMRNEHTASRQKWEGELSHVYERLNAHERPNYALWVAFIAVCVTIIVSVIGGAWAVVSLQIERVTSNRVAPLEARTTISETERATLVSGLQELQRSLTEEVAGRKAHDVGVDAQLTEIETQFDASAQELGIQFANQQRTNSVIWDALSDSGAKMPKYPGGPYYFPNISNRARRDTK